MYVFFVSCGPRYLEELRHKVHAIRNHVLVFYVGESAANCDSTTSAVPLTIPGTTSFGPASPRPPGISLNAPANENVDAMQYVLTNLEKKVSASADDALLKAARVDESFYKDAIFRDHFTSANLNLPPWSEEFLKIQTEEENLAYENQGGTGAGGKKETGAGAEGGAGAPDGRGFGGAAARPKTLRRSLLNLPKAAAKERLVQSYKNRYEQHRAKVLGRIADRLVEAEAK